MKLERHSKIVELIGKYEIETQEELAEYLNREGYNVTQATVSRDIRELKLSRFRQREAARNMRCSIRRRRLMISISGFFMTVICPWIWHRIFWSLRRYPVWPWQWGRLWIPCSFRNSSAVSQGMIR